MFAAEGAVLSEVRGGVTSCLTPDIDRVDGAEFMILALVDAPIDASLAFCARVEITDLNGTAVEDRLRAVSPGDVELECAEPTRPFPFAIPRPRG